MPQLLAGNERGWDATQIAVWREKRGWTQEKLAERSGVSVRTIRNMELGVVQNPRRSSVDLLANALGVKVEVTSDRRPAVDLFDRTHWRGQQPAAPPIVGDPEGHEELARVVRSHRLTTFFGPGGIGKTRLALSVAARLGHSFRDGVAVVELADLAPERPGQPDQSGAVRQRVRRQLRWGLAPAGTEPTGVDDDPDLELLLVLDNAEHVPAGVTAVVRELLAAYPGLQVLVTARRRLTERLGANRQITALPAEAGDDPEVPAPAVRLVLDHLGGDLHAAAGPGRDLPLVTELCRRLGGLPRYLEFAAERLRTVPVQRLLAYGPGVDMLWSSDHALLPHQRSAADSIRWDLGLLGDQHSRLLAGIAASGRCRFSVDDVTAEYDRMGMAGASPLTLLADLHETSLIRTDPLDPYRYRLAPFVAEVVDRAHPQENELEHWRTVRAS